MVSGARRSEGSGFCPESTNRVIRGGSWNNNARNCRSANRNNNNPDNRNNNNGFRLVLLPAHRHGGCRPMTTDKILLRYLIAGQIEMRR